MTAIQVQIRDLIHNEIDAYIVDNDLDIALESTYFPTADLEDLKSKPHIRIVSAAFESQRERVLRDLSFQVELPVQIAVQQKVEKKDTATIDGLVLLAETVMDLVANDLVSAVVDENSKAQTFSWLRTVPLVDENGVPYSYEQLYSRGVFEAIFNVYYKFLKPPMKQGS